MYVAGTTYDSVLIREVPFIQCPLLRGSAVLIPCSCMEWTIIHQLTVWFIRQFWLVNVVIQNNDTLAVQPFSY